MKRTYIILMAASLVLLCSCGNNQNKKKSETKAADTESVEEQYIKADLKIKLDSLVSELGRINATPIVENIDNGKVNLSAAVKKNRPDYLMPLDKVSEAVTLSEKYRALIVYYVDMRFAKLFDMPLDAYKQTLAKLIMDINDPAIPTDVEKSASLLNNMGPNVQQYYNESVKSNTVAYFWETMAAGSRDHGRRLPRAPLHHHPEHRPLHAPVQRPDRFRSFLPSDSRSRGYQVPDSLRT